MAPLALLENPMLSDYTRIVPVSGEGRWIFLGESNNRAPDLPGPMVGSEFIPQCRGVPDGSHSGEEDCHVPG